MTLKEKKRMREKTKMNIIIEHSEGKCWPGRRSKKTSPRNKSPFPRPGVNTMHWNTNRMPFTWIYNTETIIEDYLGKVATCVALFSFAHSPPPPISPSPSPIHLILPPSLLQSL